MGGSAMGGLGVGGPAMGGPAVGSPTWEGQVSGNLVPYPCSVLKLPGCERPLA